MTTATGDPDLTRLLRDPFIHQYMRTLLWAENDQSDDSGGEPLDQNYGPSHFSSAALERIASDCEAFQLEAGDLIAMDLERAGHDFWLTRNRHGAGFWDGDWPEDVAKRLTALSDRFGECWAYLGDDGLIHLA